MKNFIPYFLFFFLLSFQLQGQRLVETSTNELLVQLADGINASQFLQKLQLDSAYGIKVKKEVSLRFGFYLLEVSPGKYLDQAMQTLRNSSKVISVQPNTPLDFRGTVPDDPLWPQQWGLQRIGAPEVWDVTTGGFAVDSDSVAHEIVVAVIDRGFDVEHEDWQGNLWENPGEINGTPGVDDDGDSLIDNVNGYNFFNNSNNLVGADHGTWVTGIVGSKGNNGIGVTGVNWDVKMMLLRIETPADVVEAFEFVLEERERFNNSNGEEGSFIVATNGSFGIDGEFCELFPAWSVLYDPLGEAGVLSIAATANENWSVEEEGDMPGTCPSEYLITVTAVDTDDEKVTNASYGEISIDLGAPTFVPTTNVGNQFRESLSGTSASCPHVAGAVALLYSLPCSELADMALDDPAGAARLMRDAILDNVEPLADLAGITTTGGMIDLYESMKFLHAYCIARNADRSAGDFKSRYIEEKNFIYLSPNPVADRLKITYGNDGFSEISIRVFNSIGQEMDIQAPVANTPFSAQEIEVDVSTWSAGTYVVSISGAEKETSLRFIKI